MEQLRIKTESLSLWLNNILSLGHSVIAPVKTGDGNCEFKKIQSAEEVDYVTRITRFSLKEAVFPKSEILFRYHQDGKEIEVEDPDSVAAERTQTIVWGLRPCDAAAFAPISGIFNWDSEDILFNNKRKGLTLVSFACTEADDSCFCTSVGGGPGNTNGSDIQITIGGESSLVEILSERGAELVSRTSASFLDEKEGSFEKESVLAKVKQEFSARQICEKLERAFESDIWKKQSERCLGCGTCAFVCPTCACFDIQEHKKGKNGERIRCWDSCGFALFTQHTSGYNPRPTQATRWRQRILHKFSYMPERLQLVGCVGCGRCSRACPVDMDIKEHLSSIAHLEHE